MDNILYKTLQPLNTHFFINSKPNQYGYKFPKLKKIKSIIHEKFAKFACIRENDFKNSNNYMILMA